MSKALQQKSLLVSAKQRDRLVLSAKILLRAVKEKLSRLVAFNGHMKTLANKR